MSASEKTEKLLHREVNREKFEHSSETAEGVCEERSNAAVWVRSLYADCVPQPFKHTVDQGFFVEVLAYLFTFSTQYVDNKLTPIYTGTVKR